MPENDLISRSALIERLKIAKSKMKCVINGIKAVDIGAVIEFVGNAPAVDAVEVVRCKDCKHYLKAMMFCEHPEGLEVPDKMDFCSYGERRSDVGR
jgi:hypothetical protein